MLRRIFSALFCIFCSLPVTAHEHHHIAMRHWEDPRYVNEIRLQMLLLLVVGALMYGIKYMMQLRKMP